MNLGPPQMADIDVDNQRPFLTMGIWGMGNWPKNKHFGKSGFVMF